jgi:DNA-binding transcriptional LysR family regulator
MTDFTLTGLRVARAVSATGSFSAAAAQLGYTQSAISRQVALMERAAGAALFERHARGARPTAAGAVVLGAAGAVLSELERTREALLALEQTPRARLRVGAFSTALTALVPRAMAAFAAVQPHVRVLLSEGTSERLLAGVQAGRLDLAVVSAPTQHVRGVRLRQLLEDPLLLAVARDHPLATRENVPAEDLREERWVAGSANARSTLLGAWTGSSWRPHVAYVARDWPAKLGLVAAGQAVTIVPGLAVASLPSAVAVLRIEHPEARRATMLASPSGADGESPAAGLAETLEGIAGEIAAELTALLRDRRPPARGAH